MLEHIRSLRASTCESNILYFDLIESKWLIEGGRLAEADLRLSQLSQPITPEHQAFYLRNAAALAYELGQYGYARQLYQQLLDMGYGTDYQNATHQYMVLATHAAEAIDISRRGEVEKTFQETLRAQEKNGIARASLYITFGRVIGDSAERYRLLETGLELASLPIEKAGALGGLAFEDLEKNPARAAERMDAAIRIAASAWSTNRDPSVFLHLARDRLLVRWATLPRTQALEEVEDTLNFIEDLRLAQEGKIHRAQMFSVWSEVYPWLVGRLLEDAGPDPSQNDLALAFHFMERYRARSLVDEELRDAASKTAKTANAKLATLKDVSSRLAPNEALLAFQVAPQTDIYGRFEGDSWLMTITRESARAYSIPDRAKLQKQISIYLKLIAEDPDRVRQASTGPFRDLLKEALSDLPNSVDSLLLVPDRELHLLPFGTLRQTLDDAPLALRYQLTHLPSATLWTQWLAKRPATTEPAALVLANPKLQGLRSTESPGIRSEEEFRDLPFSELEGQRIIQQLGGRSLLRSGADATEAFFKGEDHRRYGILHFAAHARVNPTYPTLSAVRLAAGNGEDGHLRAKEIAHLDLDGQIILLSACDSATGSILRGEGVMSLARSFFQAGATTVVGSLRALDDQKAQQLFAAFYHHLDQGRSVRQALQYAQRDLRQQGMAAVDWSGVIVLGDGGRVPFPKTFKDHFLLMGAAISFVVFILFLWRHRFPRQETSSS